MIAGLVLLTVLLLAFANGANDSFKGVATIYGSRVASYRAALAWGTVTTLAGAVASSFLVLGMVRAFSGEGVVGAQVMSSARFPVALALAARGTVLLASRLGMPVSTTHALVGALAGIAVWTSSSSAWLVPLGLAFLLPLLTSPVLSLALSWAANRWTAAAADRCVCVAAAETAGPAGVTPVPVVGAESECDARGARPLVKTSWLLNGLHFLSAGATGFMRGVNDTPKLLGVLAAGGLFHPDVPLALAVGLAMLLGGVAGSRRVARTMSEHLTPMLPAQGTLANALTSAIVGAASAWSLPVSTTHVSCGAIFGLGAARRELSRKWAGAVVAGWLFTLPVSAGGAALLWCLVPR